MPEPTSTTVSALMLGMPVALKLPPAGLTEFAQPLPVAPSLPQGQGVTVLPSPRHRGVKEPLVKAGPMVAHAVGCDGAFMPRAANAASVDAQSFSCRMAFLSWARDRVQARPAFRAEAEPPRPPV